MALPNSANIVILAVNYNPSIVSKEWLYQRNIFTEPVENFVHTPVFALVENADFGLTVDEQRLQIIVKRVMQDSLAAATEIARRFVDVLPETPYKAVGLNYRYNVAEKGCDLRMLFAPKPAKLKAVFSRDFQLGARVVFSFGSFVATFTVAPSLAKEQPIRIAFNFHSNVGSIVELRERLASQTATLNKAEVIIRELCRNG